MKEVDACHCHWQHRQTDNSKGKAEGLDEQSAPRDDPSKHRCSPAVIDEVPSSSELKRRPYIRPIILKAHLSDRVSKQNAGSNNAGTDQAVTQGTSLPVHVKK
jgi:hypothetical protein